MVEWYRVRLASWRREFDSQWPKASEQVSFFSSQHPSNVEDRATAVAIEVDRWCVLQSPTVVLRNKASCSHNKIPIVPEILVLLCVA